MTNDIYRASSVNKRPKRTVHSWARAILHEPRGLRMTRSRSRNAVSRCKADLRCCHCHCCRYCCLLLRSLAGRERKANKVTTIKLTAQISRFTAPLTHSPCAPRDRARMCLLPPTIYQQCIQVGYKYAWITHYANARSFGRACPEGIVCRLYLSIAVFFSRSFRRKVYSLVARLSLDIPRKLRVTSVTSAALVPLSDIRNCHTGYFTKNEIGNKIDILMQKSAIPKICRSSFDMLQQLRD